MYKYSIGRMTNIDISGGCKDKIRGKLIYKTRCENRLHQKGTPPCVPLLITLLRDAQTHWPPEDIERARFIVVSAVHAGDDAGLPRKLDEAVHDISLATERIILEGDEGQCLTIRRDGDAVFVPTQAEAAVKIRAEGRPLVVDGGQAQRVFRCAQAVRFQPSGQRFDFIRLRIQHSDLAVF